MLMSFVEARNRSKLDCLGDHLTLSPRAVHWAYDPLRRRPGATPRSERTSCALAESSVTVHIRGLCNGHGRQASPLICTQ